MKKSLYLLLVCVLCGAFVFTAYSEESPEQTEENTTTEVTQADIEKKIIGGWIVAERNGQPALTKEKCVVTFVSPAKAYMSASFGPRPELGDYWMNMSEVQDDELVPDQEIYSYYKYQNGADTLIYTFTPAERSDDGSKPFSIRKPVGIKRIDTPDQEAETEAAVYEFYNVFPADTLKTGTSYKVTVQAYDRKDVAIEGAACDFTLTR